MAENNGQTRIVVIWNAKGITVQSQADRPTIIAALEMAKGLMIKETLGPARTHEAGKSSFTRAPTYLPRQVDQPS